MEALGWIFTAIIVVLIIVGIWFDYEDGDDWP
jgi:hypothetical protein